MRPFKIYELFGLFFSYAGLNDCLRSQVSDIVTQIGVGNKSLGVV